MSDTYAYPFDPTGLASSNLVQNEQHTTTNINSQNYFYIVPKFSPFFADGLVVTYTNLETHETRTLDRVIDYDLAFLFYGATHSIGKVLYGALSIYNLDADGVINITYQTLGGEWCVDQEYVLEKLAEHNYNPRTINWDQLTNVQETFPPISHDLSAEYIYDSGALMNALKGIEDKIAGRITPEESFTKILQINERISVIESTINTINDTISSIATGLQQHINRVDNPHRTSKTQTSLGNVENVGITSSIELLAGVGNNLITLNQLRSVLKEYTLGNDVTVSTAGYVLSMNKYSTTTGTGIIGSFTTTGGSNGDTYYYSIGHVTTNDNNFINTAGSFIVNNNYGNFTILISDKDIAANVSFSVTVRKDSPTGRVIANSPLVTITA